jgi:hypothetical protein
MRQRLTGALGTPGFGDFVGNLAGPAYKSLRTPGAGSASRIQPAPTSLQKWTILSVSIYGLLGYFNTINGAVFGKFGKIYGGLVLDAGDFPTQTFTTLPNLPTDPALTAPMWDSAVNEMPPPFGGTLPPSQATIAGFLPVSVSISPPVPLDMTPQYSPLVGIWFNPSLLGSSVVGGFQGLDLENISYSVNYDDGLGG